MGMQNFAKNSAGGVPMKRGELTRQRIIEQSAPIFNMNGYAGCSMQDVMAATGLEKGGIYRYFESKEELAAEAFKYSFGKSVKTRTEDLAGVKGAVAKLRFFVARFVETPTTMRGGCPLMNAAVDSDDGNPVLRKLVEGAFRTWKSRIRRIVNEGHKMREINATVSADSVANTMIAMLEGALLLSRVERKKSALLDAKSALNLYLDAIERR
jgi:TetR/AcrR family transcriptional regulator, transcriptional repressor for nem operon